MELDHGALPVACQLGDDEGQPVFTDSLVHNLEVTILGVVKVLKTMTWHSAGLPTSAAVKASPILGGDFRCLVYEP